MSKEVYLIISICILALLLATFIVTFIMYKRTPVPKGCEFIKISEENCSACQNKACSHYLGEDKE